MLSIEDVEREKVMHVDKNGNFLCYWTSGKRLLLTIEHVMTQFQQFQQIFNMLNGSLAREIVAVGYFFEKQKQFGKFGG